VAARPALAAGRNSVDDRSGSLCRCHKREGPDFRVRDYRLLAHGPNTPVADRGPILALAVLPHGAPASSLAADLADDTNPKTDRSAAADWSDAVAAPAAASREADQADDSARSH